MPLTPWQQFVSDKFPGANNEPNQQQWADLAQQYFGNIPLPPGVDESQVTSRNGASVSYKDAQGYIHTINRIIDGRNPNAGQVQPEQISNAPAVPAQSSAGELDMTKNVLGQLQNYFNQAQSNLGTNQTGQTDNWLNTLSNLTNRLAQPPALAQLDPATQANLAQISNSEQQQLNQQFNDQSNQLLTRLFGNGVQRSSIAGAQAARMLQQQGLVQAQQQANAAQRQLGVQQYLSQLGQGNLALGSQNALGGGQLSLDEIIKMLTAQNQQANTMGSFISNALNNSTQRDTANASVGLGQQQLAEQQRQFEQNFQQNYIAWQEQQRLIDRQNTMNNIFRGVGLAAGIATGIPGLFGGAASNNTGAPAPATGTTQATGWTQPILAGGSYSVPPLTWPSGGY